MTIYTTEDIADAHVQFWRLVQAVRITQRRDPMDPELPSLYEDVDYFRVRGITARIRQRCADMLADWRRLICGEPARTASRLDAYNDREPA